MIGNNNAAASYLDVRRMPCNVLIDSPHSEHETAKGGKKTVFSSNCALSPPPPPPPSLCPRDDEAKAKKERQFIKRQAMLENLQCERVKGNQ
jgi:hypothetical protein